MEALAKLIEALTVVAKRYGIATVIALLAIAGNVYLVGDRIKQYQKAEELDRATRIEEAKIMSESLAKMSTAVDEMSRTVAQMSVNTDRGAAAVQALTTQIAVLAAVSGGLRRTAAQHQTTVNQLSESVRVLEMTGTALPAPAEARKAASPSPLPPPNM
jgi:methyl-accepting chemotaxis protein